MCWQGATAFRDHSSATAYGGIAARCGPRCSVTGARVAPERSVSFAAWVPGCRYGRLLNKSDLFMINFGKPQVSELHVDQKQIFQQPPIAQCRLVVCPQVGRRAGTKFTSLATPAPSVPVFPIRLS